MIILQYILPNERPQISSRVPTIVTCLTQYEWFYMENITIETYNNDVVLLATLS